MEVQKTLGSNTITKSNRTILPQKSTTNDLPETPFTNRSACKRNSTTTINKANTPAYL